MNFHSPDKKRPHLLQINQKARAVWGTLDSNYRSFFTFCISNLFIPYMKFAITFFLRKILALGHFALLSNVEIGNRSVVSLDLLLSINEEDSYRFSDSRSLMSKLPRRVSASAGLPKGVQLGFCMFSKRSFTCLDTTVYSFRSHISPQTSLRDSPPLDLKR